MQGDLVEFVSQWLAWPLPAFRNQDDHLGRTLCDVLGQPQAQSVVLLDTAVEPNGSHVLLGKKEWCPGPESNQ